MGISTFKNEGENLKKIQAFDEVKGAQVQTHIIKRFGTQVVWKNIPWKKEMEGWSERITSNENGS